MDAVHARPRLKNPFFGTRAQVSGMTRDPVFRKAIPRRKIKLFVLPTAKAIKTLKQNPNETNAILHVTC